MAVHPLVELAFLHPGEVSASFMSSLVRCRDYELVRTRNLFQIRERRARSGSIAKARNEVTKMFLRSKNEYLLFVDADMGFPRDAVERFLATAHRTERPIVGALCFAHRTEGFDEETNAEYFGHIPTISFFERDDTGTIIGFQTMTDYPRDTVLQADSTGAACVLIHRSVLERMQETYDEHWWTQLPHPQKPEPFGEDTSFFIRANELGIPLHIDTGIRTSHDKGGIFLTEHTYAEQEILREYLAAQIEMMNRKDTDGGSRNGEPGPASSGPGEERSGRTGLEAGRLLGSGPAS